MSTFSIILLVLTTSSVGILSYTLGYFAGETDKRKAISDGYFLGLSTGFVIGKEEKETGNG